MSLSLNMERCNPYKLDHPKQLDLAIQTDHGKLLKPQRPQPHVGEARVVSPACLKHHACTSDHLMNLFASFLLRKQKVRKGWSGKASKTTTSACMSQATTNSHLKSLTLGERRAAEDPSSRQLKCRASKRLALLHGCKAWEW